MYYLWEEDESEHPIIVPAAFAFFTAPLPFIWILVGQTKHFIPIWRCWSKGRRRGRGHNKAFPVFIRDNHIGRDLREDREGGG